MKTLRARIGLTFMVLALLAAVATPAKAANRRFIQIAAGGLHACALSDQGRAYCWGSNANGQLGNGDSSHATQLTAVAVKTNQTFIQIAASVSATCALTQGGRVFCWGSNTGWGGRGILGTGNLDIAYSDIPLSVQTDQRFTQISAASISFCGVTRFARIYCWGGNSYAQLGNGTYTDSSIPFAINSGERFLGVTTGNWYACGLTTSKSVYCWGIGYTETPTQKYVAEPVVRIEATETQLCALTARGSLLCDSDGLFQRSDTRYQDLAISSGEVYSLCAITRGGSVDCWWNPATPNRLNSDLRFDALSQGGTYAWSNQFTCGLTKAGIAYCWGENWNGQLGNGTTDASAIPTRVR